jgi:hypothetical protein
MTKTLGCSHMLPMSDISKMAERLLMQATICRHAASLCWNEEIAIELERLADDCRQAALACQSDVFGAPLSVRKH